jgi:polyisoprenoid-binding protein YceI
MTSDPATTTLTELPLAAGVWTVDQNSSGVYFKLRHLGLANVRGRFTRFDATLVVGSTLADTQVEATIETTSIDTAQPDRDAHLLGPEYLSAEQHPVATFRSTGVRAIGESDFAVDGELTLNGVTRPVTLDVEFLGVEVFPGDGSTRAGFFAATNINRDEFGVDANMPLGLGKFALGKKVAVELELQFVAARNS